MKELTSTSPLSPPPFSRISSKETHTRVTNLLEACGISLSCFSIATFSTAAFSIATHVEATRVCPRLVYKVGIKSYRLWVLCFTWTNCEFRHCCVLIVKVIGHCLPERDHFTFYLSREYQYIETCLVMEDSRVRVISNFVNLAIRQCMK